MTQHELPQPHDPILPPDEPHEEDPVISQVKQEMAKIFPTYATLDRSRWDDYDPQNQYHPGRGRLLTFFQGEKGRDTPNVMFIFKEDGYAINFYNNPQGKRSEKHLGIPGSTVYKDMLAGQGEFWPMADLERATEAARMTMEGIPLTPETLDQPTFFVGDDNNVVSLRSVIEGAQQFRRENKNMKTKEMEEAMREKFQPTDIFTVLSKDSEAVKQLVLDRFAQQAENNIPFVMGGKTLNPQDVIEEINNNTLVGKKALLLEVTRMNIYLELLWILRLI